MLVQIYIVLDEKADRPYVSTTPPTGDRALALLAHGCRVYEVTVALPEPLPLAGKIEVTAIASL